MTRPLVSSHHPVSFPPLTCHTFRINGKIFGLVYNSTPQVQTWYNGPKLIVLYTRFYGIYPKIRRLTLKGTDCYFRAFTVKPLF